jgi:hypothetical protein
MKVRSIQAAVKGDSHVTFEASKVRAYMNVLQLENVGKGII